MRIEAGQRVGPYEILALAGVGGMGEVYRARDARMSRDVAVKVLPESLAGNRDRLQRFEQEARAAGMLNHPNLLTVYDVGTHEASPYIVAEFLEGETLRAKLDAGRAGRPGDSAAPIPMRKAIEWAQQLAAGLGAAHDRGIVHRDLKPENIFVTRDGRVKILDFGLAKLMVSRDSGVDAQDTTQQQQQTDPGTVMGTVGYMSPEQVRAQPFDHRSDIFSFGAILYEMFTGTRAFRRDTSVDTMSAILHDDPPPVATLNAAVPPAVERLISHCLEKNPEERFQSARDLAFALASLTVQSGQSVQASRPIQRVRRSLAVVAAALMLGAGFGAGWLASRWRHAGAVAPATTRLLTFSGRDSNPAISPDRRTIVFSSDRDDRRRLWVKELATGGEVAITDGIDDFPRFSPDGSTVLFIRTENGIPSLYRTSVVGGTPRRLLSRVQDADFTRDGRQILYVPSDPSGGPSGQVNIMNADGSMPRPLATVRGALGRPRSSPDGKWIALVDLSPGNLRSPAWLISADGKTTRRIGPPKGFGTVSAITWLDAQHVIFTAPENVAGFAAGAPQQVLLQDIDETESRALLTNYSGQAVEVAGDDRLILDGYATRQNLHEVSTTDPTYEKWLSHGSAIDRQPIYSRDGQWVAFSSNRSGNLDVWAVNRSSGAVIRVTDDAAEDFDPAYTPDGRHLVWSSNRGGNFEVWVADADGSGARQLTHDGVDAENPTVTLDGRWVVYNSYNPKNSGILKIPFAGGNPIMITRGATELPDVSPDGKWVSFHDVAQNELKVADVNTRQVIAFSRMMSRSLITATGRSRWTADGKRIAWIDRDDGGRWTLVEQDFVPGKDTAATRHILSQSSGVAGGGIETFAFSPDGVHLITSVNEELDGVYLAERVPFRQ